MPFRKSFLAALVWLAMAGALAPAVRCQSSDQNLPTAVLANEINGRIPARDLGDPRVTRHFYAFEGTPGDLLITLDSRNLNGDIDIFTSVTFRPLMKTTMYANTQSPGVTKGIYLRSKQVLILRVEARTPNDDDGVYHIRFGGAFSPFSGGIPVAENSGTQSDIAPSTGGNKRLSSAGATIAEPVKETPAAESKTSTDKAAANSGAETGAARKTTTTKATRTRPTRTTARRGSRPAPAKPTPAKKPADDTTAKTESEAAKRESSVEEKSVAVSEKSAATEKPATSEKPATQEPVAPQPGARLIIEEKDGTKIERPMSTVRRVVVEGNTIVIVLKTGKIERISMTIVARMAIEP